MRYFGDLELRGKTLVLVRVFFSWCSWPEDSLSGSKALAKWNRVAWTGAFEVDGALATNSRWKQLAVDLLIFNKNLSLCGSLESALVEPVVGSGAFASNSELASACQAFGNDKMTVLQLRSFVTKVNTLYEILV